MHIVREYHKGDPVRFFSTERGEWEEMPTDLIDLDKTEAEPAEHERFKLQLGTSISRRLLLPKAGACLLRKHWLVQAHF